MLKLMCGEMGGARIEHEVHLDAGDALDALGKSLKGRSSIILVCYIRWSAAAVCCGGWPWKAMLTHMDTVCQLEESERIRNPWLGSAIALLYDELSRKYWHQTPKQCNPTYANMAMLEDESLTRAKRLCR